MSERIIPVVGTCYGLLTVEENLGVRGRDTWVRCRCACGNLHDVRFGALRTGNTRSCGCYHYVRQTRHGMSGHPLYKVWGGAVQRCENPNSSRYHRYGGRGISICQEWRHDPGLFIKHCLDVGWTPDLSVDRIDNDGDYCPGNIRAVSMHDNLMNRQATQARREAARRNVIKAWSAGLKPVRCVETGQEFPTLTAAAEWVNRAVTNLGKSVVRGGTCGGYHFEYLERGARS